MKKINLIVATCLIAFSSCSQTKQQKTKIMELFIDSVMQHVKHYDNTPVYSLQINKAGCRMLVETNDFPPGYIGTLYSNQGESMMIGLNRFILKSGKQKIKLKIYPREQDEFISGYAHLDIKLFYNSNKDSGFSNYVQLAQVGLPEDIVDRKLAYSEIEIPFEAKVPYDFSSRLDSAVDLKAIPNIEKKVLEKFEAKRSLIEKGKEVEYGYEDKESIKMLGNMFYATKKELWEFYEAGREIFDANRKGREVLPIENYEIVFYANNKLVTIRRNDNKGDVLKAEFKKDGKLTADASYSLDLYMTKGSNEFKVW